MSGKKICHMTSAHGVEDVRIFHKECVSLAEEGYEVYLVERGKSYEKNSVQIVGVGEMPAARRKRMIEGTKKVYRAAVELDCDLYHIHDPELLPYALKLKKKGKRVVFDSHELTRNQIQVKHYLPSAVAKVLSFLYGLYENYILSRIDGVIFPCTVDGSFPLPGKRKVFLNNVPKMSEMYEKYEFASKKDKNVICTIGSLTYNRGIKHLVKAAYEANCILLLGGIFVPESFKDEIYSMPESSCIEYLGYINREEVVDVYKRSLAGISAVLNVGQYRNVENLSTKVYECMAMGIPVIISKLPYSERVIEQYKFGICVDPENIEEFKNAIMYLVDNPENARTMGLNGRNAIKNHFNWDIEKNNLFNLYKDIFNE